MENLGIIVSLIFEIIGAITTAVVLTIAISAIIFHNKEKDPLKGLYYGERKKKPLKIRMRKWMQKN